MRAAVMLAFVVLLAGAYSPPPLHGHVVDTTASFTASEVRDLDLTIDAMGNTGGFVLVVLITDLGAESIEDIAYTAFNTWGVGDKGKDNGVLLVIAPKEHRARIETGKGVGGALPDLKTNDIIRQRIAPLLQQGQLRTAIEDGAIAISQVLRADESWTRANPTRQGSQAQQGGGDTSSDGSWKLIVGGVVALLVLVGISRKRGALGGRSGGGGGGWWGGGGFGGGFGGGGGGGLGGGDGGGSGYSGGGGHSGGGGSSDSF